jgi:hypothetical protein
MHFPKHCVFQFLEHWGYTKLPELRKDGSEYITKKIKDKW